MAGAGALPRGRRLGPVLAWLLPAAVTAAAAGAAVATVSAGARAQVAVCGAVAAVAAALLAAEAGRRGRRLALLRHREAVLEQRLAEQEALTARLAEHDLPAAVARVQRGDFVEEVLRDAAADRHGFPGLRGAHLGVLRSVLEAVSAEENLRESAQRAFVNIARRVQAIVHQQAQDLQEMEQRHGRSPDVFDDLLRLDHGFARVGRLADSMAVLGGARPGRQWPNAVPLYNVLRGAMSRILDYQRVELHSVSEVAIVGPAVEPLIHALAELLDNATRYSPPQTRVHLTAVDVQAGIAVEIEDGGLGLTEEGRERAERMLSEAHVGIDLNDLGETPRLGLTVVGRLARAYNFEVALRPSAYRGVRAVLIVPKHLTTVVPLSDELPGLGAAYGQHPVGRGSAAGQEAVPGSLAVRQRTGPRRRTPATDLDLGPDHGRSEFDDGAGSAEQSELSARGLPQRRRRVPQPAAPEAAAEAPVEPGMWLSAFQNAVSSTSDLSDTSDESSDELE